MLYLVSTPIGNLADISLRAIDVLKKCDYILCEDTRHSRRLLQHYQIDAALHSFHMFNETKAENRIIEDLKTGKTLALISDAGTPLISDPGQELVVKCRKEGISVSAVPGPCAITNALVLSGLPPSPFQFIGFLPKGQKDLQITLSKALMYHGTTVAYESPHRIEETLSMFLSLSKMRTLCVARELTKLHEECLSGNAEELLAHFSQHPPRGEMVLLIEPPPQQIAYEDLSVKELVEMLQREFQLSKGEAIKMAAHLHLLPKRKVYEQLINNLHNNFSSSTL